MSNRSGDLNPRYSQTNRAFKILAKTLQGKVGKNGLHVAAEKRVIENNSIFVLCPGAGSYTNIDIIQQAVEDNFIFSGRPQRNQKRIVILCLEHNPHFVEQANMFFSSSPSRKADVFFETVDISDYAQIKTAMTTHDIPRIDMVYMAHPVVTIKEEGLPRILPNLMSSFFSPSRYSQTNAFEEFIVRHLPELLTESRGIIVAVTTNKAEIARLNSLLSSISSDESKEEKLEQGKLTQANLSTQEKTTQTRQLQGLKLSPADIGEITKYYNFIRVWLLPATLASADQRQQILAKETSVTIAPSVSGVTHTLKIALLLILLSQITEFFYQHTLSQQPSPNPGSGF